MAAAHSINIQGIDINFPCDPYDVQIEYMKKVLLCLEERKFGLLESPTGTGKTIALLCSTLAWMQVQRLRRLAGASLTAAASVSSDTWSGPLTKTKVIYSSRTHSQLAQVIKEFQRSHYRHLRAVILGSRDQLCINQQVMASTSTAEKNNLCRAKVKSHTCEYFDNLDRNRDNLGSIVMEVPDIENLKKVGTQRRMCPYYLSRNLSSEADVIFLPYNYLLDPSIRKTMGIDLEESIIILDEAHNILRNCEDAASITFEIKDIALAMSELDYVIGCLETDSLVDSMDVNMDLTIPDVCVLKDLISKVEAAVQAFVEKNLDSKNEITGDRVYSLLGEGGLNESTYVVAKQLIDKTVEFLSAVSLTSGQQKGRGLTNFLSFVDLIFQTGRTSSTERLKSYYRVYVELSKFSKQKNYLLHLWCFHPGFCMQSLIDCKVRSILLTSGTLKPLESFHSELGANFPIHLQNEHVIKPNQLLARVVAKGSSDVTLLSTFKTRSDPKYLDSLGQSILEVAKESPDGLLIFFPSYSVMNNCIQHWQNGLIWNRLNGVKPIYIEPKEKNMLETVVKEFRSSVKEFSPRGSILMAVCRGKISEGIDFADKDARTVIITGIPFPNIMDARITLKRKYLDFRKCQKLGSMSGAEWYNLEAFRAVNQAVGRVIRHKNDFGAVLFFDTRFSDLGVKTKLPEWMRSDFKANNLNKVLSDMRSFFQENKQLSVSRPPSIKRPLSPKSNGVASASTSAQQAMPKKRKKIVIKPRMGDDEVAPQQPDGAATFVKELKKLLDKPGLLLFKTGIKEYKENGKLDSLTDILREWIASKKVPLATLSGIKFFVRDKDIQEFEKFMENAS